MIIILKMIGIFFVVAFGICATKKISDNFNAWNYERNHKEYLKLREECRKEYKRRFKE